MSALSVFLMVLKIIGLVLAGIIGLVLFVLLIVLFVPIKYSASGNYAPDDIRLSAKASWLFHALSFSYVYGKDSKPVIKVLGIELKKKDKVNKSKSRKKKKDKLEGLFENDDIYKNDSDEIAEETEEPEETKETKETKETEEPQNTKEPNEPDLHKDATESEPLENGTAKSTDKKKSSKKNSLYGKIKKYIEIIRSATFEKAFEKAKDRIFKLLKHILPRKWKINLDVSFEDPATTGTVLGISSMLYPITKGNLQVYSDFSDPHFLADGFLKGHITVCKVLWLAGSVYFDRRIKKIIKLFREV